MLPLSLVLAAAVAALPSTVAVSPAVNLHRPAPGAHNVFSSSSNSLSGLAQRAEIIANDLLVDEALCDPADDVAAPALNWVEEPEDARDNTTTVDKRGLRSARKLVVNPKNSGRSTAATSTTAVAATQSQPSSSSSAAASSRSTSSSRSTTDSKTSSSSSRSASSTSTTSRSRTSGSTPRTLPKSTKTSSTKTSSTKTTTTPTTTSKKTTTTTKSTTKKTSTTTTKLVLPTPPSTTCYAQYTNTAGGAVYGPGLGDFPMSPRPSTFVKRSGSGLTLDGNEYRIVGPNIYWLGLDENVNWTPSYPDKGRVREAMAISVAMGANTIRAHTLGISTGTSLSVWPSSYNTNNDAFDSIDYAIWAARNYGLRLIIPLTDEHAYYHGGKYDFISWAGLDTSDGYQFYTSSAVKKIFKDYIKVLLTHVNQYTGVALKDDPTILAWETGNELGAYMLSAGAPPADWTSEIATYIKSLAPKHLVADGTDGLVDYGGSTQNTGLDVSGVDLVTDHFYPALNWLLNKDAGIMNSKSKNFYVGELDWTYEKGGDSPSSFYSIIESMPGAGSMIWSVFGHDAQCCNWVTHDDGYSLYYPNGNSDVLQKRILVLAKHWWKLRGLTAPTVLPAVACPQPALLA